MMRKPQIHPSSIEKKRSLGAKHPLYSKFVRVTKQEEQHGLLDDSRLIGTKDGWESRLRETGFVLRGHRLLRTSPMPVEKVNNDGSSDIHG